MTPLRVRPEAELDIFEASIWYENERDGLGEVFIGAVRRSLQRVEHGPEEFPVVFKDVRRALVSRFPFGVSSSARTRRARYWPSFICTATRARGPGADSVGTIVIREAIAGNVRHAAVPACVWSRFTGTIGGTDPG